DIDAIVLRQRSHERMPRRRVARTHCLAVHLGQWFQTLPCFQAKFFPVDNLREDIHSTSRSSQERFVVSINLSSLASAASLSTLLAAIRAASRRLSAKPPTCNAAAAFIRTKFRASSCRLPETTSRMM